MQGLAALGPKPLFLFSTPSIPTTFAGSYYSKEKIMWYFRKIKEKILVVGFNVDIEMREPNEIETGLDENLPMGQSTQG